MKTIFKISTFIIITLISIGNTFAYSLSELKIDLENAIEANNLPLVTNILNKWIENEVITKEEWEVFYKFAKNEIVENSISLSTQKFLERRDKADELEKERQMEIIRKELETNTLFRAMYNWPLPEWFSHPDIDYRIANWSYTYWINKEEKIENNVTWDVHEDEKDIDLNLDNTLSLEELFWETLEDVITVKEKNIYVKKLSWQELENFYKMRDNITNIVEWNQSKKLNKLSTKDKKTTIDNLNKKIRTLKIKTKNYYKKAILEEIKIQIETI